MRRLEQECTALFATLTEEQAERVQEIIDEAFGNRNLDDKQIPHALEFLLKVLKEVISLDRAEGIRTPVVAAPKQKGFRGAPKVPSKLRQKRPAITKVVDAYHDPVKPVEEVAYLSVDLPCTRTPVVVPKSQSLKPDVTTPEIRPAKPRQKGVYSTEDLESYYVPGMPRESYIEESLNENPK
ncbi:hypothetical protein C2G38_2042832 [Gigaspora rosea]|uniref:Uncharacterized protein n=1 Tax=Gigaspora rosea TaxID=44941 RepID=A0A397UPL7_9GLOM|nr:hypothetical protein C2G38_2042832 [Gigaspora rosea]